MFIHIIFNILKKNPQIKEFLSQIENFETFLKKLSYEEIKRLNLEFPDLLKSEQKFLL